MGQGDRSYLQIAGNETSWDALVDEIWCGASIAPFVGAGASVVYGFPTWTRYLQDLSDDHRLEEVPRLLSMNRHEDAAESLFRYLGRETFFDSLLSTFDKPFSLVDTTAVAQIPALAGSFVITTNFDPVLEATFRAAGREPVVIDRPSAAEEAIRNGETNLLIKLHGSVTNRDTIVFAKSQYDQAYGYRQRPILDQSISYLLERLVRGHVLLFIGCSLTFDRTLASLQEISRYSDYRLFGIVQESGDRRLRQLELKERGIVPIWFRTFDQIPMILADLSDEVAAARCSAYQPSNETERYIERLCEGAAQSTAIELPDVLSLRGASLSPFSGLRNRLQILTDDLPGIRESRLGQLDAGATKQTASGGPLAPPPSVALGSVAGHACLFGGPGSGKSWCLAFRAHLHAKKTSAAIRRGKSYFGNTLPVFVPLSMLFQRFARENELADLRWLEENLASVAAAYVLRPLPGSGSAIEGTTTQGLNELIETLSHEIYMGRAFILLDGWDEVLATELLSTGDLSDSIEAFRGLLNEFALEYESEILISSRYVERGKPVLQTARSYAVASYTNREVKAYLRWALSLSPSIERRVAEWFDASPSLQEMLSQPSHLQMVCWVAREKTSPDTTRAALYSSVVDAYFSQLRAPSDAKLALASACWSSLDGVFISHHHLAEACRRYGIAEEEVLGIGIIYPLGYGSGDLYIFHHRSIKEFLSAWYLQYSKGELRQLLTDSERRSLPHRHQESLIFLVGLSGGLSVLSSIWQSAITHPEQWFFESIATRCLLEIPPQHLGSRLVRKISKRILDKWWEYTTDSLDYHPTLVPAVRCVALLDSRLEVPYFVHRLRRGRIYRSKNYLMELTLRYCSGTLVADAIIEDVLRIIQVIHEPKNEEEWLQYLSFVWQYTGFIRPGARLAEVQKRAERYLRDEGLSEDLDENDEAIRMQLAKWEIFRDSIWENLASSLIWSHRDELARFNEDRFALHRPDFASRLLDFCLDSESSLTAK